MTFDERSGRPRESFAVLRTVLHGALQACAAVPIRLATVVVSVRPADPGVAVTFADGRIDRFAVVVGADGARSRVRRSAFAESELHSSGVRCWRFVARDSRQHRDVIEFLGNGRRVGLIPLPNAETYVFATAEPDVAGSADEPPEKKLRRLFAGFAAPIPELLAGELRAFRFEVLGTLAFPRFARGRIALLGDAAHCMSPNLAQGAALAMEDAVTLAAALHAEGATPHALQSYSRRRAARVRRIAFATDIAGRVAHVRHPWLRAMRDGMLRSSSGATASILGGLLAWGMPNGRQEWH
jgi:2-polyprenyl-6-methoxyphenol hydroxylase-like FAD-dependent oxidoreductase